MGVGEEEPVEKKVNQNMQEIQPVVARIDMTRTGSKDGRSGDYASGSTKIY